jgi:quercetin dioxygenase-like cupin family protein
MSEQAIIFDRLATLELSQSRPVIYDRPIGVRLLYRDPGSGAEHYLIRYPAALQALHHRHSAAHTIIVLDGVLTANGQLIGPGGYCHFPAGTVMHYAPAGDVDCLFVTIFDGPQDVQPVE